MTVLHCGLLAMKSNYSVSDEDHAYDGTSSDDKIESEAYGSIENADVHVHTMQSVPAGMDPAVTSGDFGKVMHLKSQRELTDEEKFYLLKHHFVPGKTFQFPLCTFDKQQRQFQSSWLEKYNGLKYMMVGTANFVLCLLCVNHPYGS